MWVPPKTLDQSFQKLEHGQDRHRDREREIERHTDETKGITQPHSRVVMIVLNAQWRLTSCDWQLDTGDVPWRVAAAACIGVTVYADR